MSDLPRSIEVAELHGQPVTDHLPAKGRRCAGHFPFNADPARFASVLCDFMVSTEPAQLEEKTIEEMLRHPGRTAA